MKNPLIVTVYENDDPKELELIEKTFNRLGVRFYRGTGGRGKNYNPPFLFFRLYSWDYVEKRNYNVYGFHIRVLEKDAAYVKGVLKNLNLTPDEDKIYWYEHLLKVNLPALIMFAVGSTVAWLILRTWF